VLGNGHILKIDPPGGSADMSMVLTVLVLNIYGTADHPVPTWMRDLVLIFIAPALRRCWWWRLRAVFCGQLLTYLWRFQRWGSGVVQADFFSRSILV